MVYSIVCFVSVMEDCVSQCLLGFLVIDLARLYFFFLFLFPIDFSYFHGMLSLGFKIMLNFYHKKNKEVNFRS